MRDINDRQFELVAQALDQRQNLEPALDVERRERLVEKKQFGTGQQGAADRDPLPLATRKTPRPACEQMADAERLDDGFEPNGALPLAREPAPEQKVLFHRKMREEMRILKDEADAPPVRRHEDVLLRIDEGALVEANVTAARPRQTGDQVDDGRFAGAGAAKQRRDPGVVGERDIERERAGLPGDGDIDHSPLARCFSARF